MKSLFNAISQRTPQVFARFAAFSIALGVISTAIFQAPVEIKEMLPAEVFQGAKFISIVSWALNLFCISQREYESELNRKENDVPPTNEQ